MVTINWEHVYTILLARLGDATQARDALLYLMQIEDDLEADAEDYYRPRKRFK